MTLLQHYPWSKANPLPEEDKYISLFEEFILQPKCPASVTVPYARVKLRWQQNNRFNHEAHSPDQEVSTSTDNIEDEDILNALALTETMANTNTLFDELQEDQIDYGKSHSWGTRINDVSFKGSFVLHQLFYICACLLKLIKILLLCSIRLPMMAALGYKRRQIYINPTEI
jgi:hypothetical protein